MAEIIDLLHKGPHEHIVSSVEFERLAKNAKNVERGVWMTATIKGGRKICSLNPRCIASESDCGRM